MTTELRDRLVAAEADLVAARRDLTEARALIVRLRNLVLGVARDEVKVLRSVEGYLATEPT